MFNLLRNFWKRNPSLDHFVQHFGDLDWYATCPTESKEIAEQVYQGDDANFWANTLLVVAIVCIVLGYFIYYEIGWWLWLLVAWAIVYKIKIRLTKVVNVNYEMDEKSENASTLLVSMFSCIANCEKVMEITGSESFSDTNHIKNHGGSNCDLSHEDASADMKLPFPVRSNKQGVTLEVGKVKILALADCVYILASNKCTPIAYSNIQWHVSTTKIIEETPPSDVEIVGETWQHVNKNGGRDMRYKENKKLLICRYGEVLISFGDVLRVTLLISDINAAKTIHGVVSR